MFDPEIFYAYILYETGPTRMARSPPNQLVNFKSRDTEWLSATIDKSSSLIDLWLRFYFKVVPPFFVGL